MKNPFDKYSLQKALPYLLPVAVEAGNELLKFLGTYSADSATQKMELALAAMVVGDLVRALTAREKPPATVIHRFALPAAPDYHLYDETTQPR